MAEDRKVAVVSPRVTHLSPDADRVPDVVFAVGKLPDAVVDGDTALPGGKVFLCHLYPAQRTHSETLEGKGKRQKRDSWVCSGRLYLPHCG